MSKIDFGLFFLIMMMVKLMYLLIKMNKSFISIKDQLEETASELDHLNMICTIRGKIMLDELDFESNFKINS